MDTMALINLMMENKGREFYVELTNGVYNSMHKIRYGGRLMFEREMNSTTYKWYPFEFAEFFRDAEWEVREVHDEALIDSSHDIL